MIEQNYDIFSDMFGELIRRLPFGVVAGIAPFNFPLLLALKKVVYALAAGNTFVLKPASATPVSGVMIAKALDAAGLPAGVFNLVPGSGEAVGNRLVEDPRIDRKEYLGAQNRQNGSHHCAGRTGHHLRRSRHPSGGVPARPHHRGRALRCGQLLRVKERDSL